MQNATLSMKNFHTLVALNSVSDITSTTLRCMKTSRILQFFCYDYIEDLLAPIAFAKDSAFWLE